MVSRQTGEGRGAVEKPELEALRAAVEHLHGCPAFFMAAETVFVTLRGQTVLQRDVASFVLGKPSSPVVYAWMESGSTSPMRTIHHRVVLRDGQVQSAQDAIRFGLLLLPPDVPASPSSDASRELSSQAERPAL